MSIYHLVGAPSISFWLFAVRNVDISWPFVWMVGMIILMMMVFRTARPLLKIDSADMFAFLRD